MPIEIIREDRVLKDILVSVIIPVYKVEKYLNQCVDSVLCQTYKNIEVILVDDGSPDKCPQICDEYAKKDERVRVIHQKNGGLSAARNAGIKVVTGDYVLFLDSDDFWNSRHGLEVLVKRLKITNPDVLCYTYKKYFDDTLREVYPFKNIKSQPIELLDKIEQLEYMTKNSLYIACAWNKFIRSSLLSEELYFREGRLSEDIEWCAKLIKEAKSFDFINEVFYCYRQRLSSITHTMGEKSCVDLKDNIIECIKIIDGVREDIRVFMYRYIAYQIATFVAVQAIAEKCPKKCISELSKYQWILSYHVHHKKVMILHYICKIVGFEKLCRIICIIKKGLLKK